MEPKNRLREIFSAIGIELIRPTDQLLAEWGMSANRFNQLLNNKGRVSITVAESKNLEKWLKAHFAGSHQYLFEEDMPPHERMALGRQQELALR